MSTDAFSLIQSLLFDSLVIAFLVFGILAAAAGIGLIVCRAQAFRLFTGMNRHISTRQAMKPASVPHDIGPVVHRYRWWFAIAITIGAAYSLYSLLTHFDTQPIARAITSPEAPSVMTITIVDSLRWFMVAASAIALMVGILLGFFPGTLSAIEAYSNRWYSMRKVTAPLEVPRWTLDRWVEAHPAISGWGITVGALIVIISSAIMLFGK